MLIARRMFRLWLGSLWWEVVDEPGNDETELCDDILREIFEIPEDLKVLTVSLYTKPAPQRVRVVYWPGQHSGQFRVADKDIPPSSDNSVDVWREDVPEVVKSKRKIFYAEITWEE